VEVCVRSCFHYINYLIYYYLYSILFFR
jgi:hypothetical protein